MTNIVKSVRKASVCLYQGIFTLLAMSGILLDRVTPLRVLSWLLIVANILFTWVYGASLSLTFAVVFFIVMFVLRYGVLFLSFTDHGMATMLTRKFGEKRGYEVYETLTALLFFYRGSSFNLFIERTASQWVIFQAYATFFTGIAWLLIAVATLVNLWSTLIVGMDVYYYKDMFVQRKLGDFQMAGPFRYFSNPMYGIGQGTAYGAALLYGSVWGIGATALNQLAMYTFYFAFEKPHIKRIFEAKVTQLSAEEIGQLVLHVQA